MKKQVVVAFFAFILSVSFASAYYFPSMRMVSQDLVYTVTDLLEPILMALFGPWSSVYVFETLLIFLIVLSLVYIALGRIEAISGQTTVKWILTIVIPLLSVRFFDYEWLVTVFNSYKLLGIILSSVLPFIIYFYFLYNVSGDHGIIRKLGWALWIAVYVGLWSAEHVGEYTSMVYFWTFIAGIICLIGDNLINRRLRALEIMKRDNYFQQREIGRLNMDIQEIQRQMAAGAIDHNTGRKAIKDLTRHREWLRKQ